MDNENLEKPETKDIVIGVAILATAAYGAWRIGYDGAALGQKLIKKIKTREKTHKITDL